MRASDLESGHRMLDTREVSKVHIFEASHEWLKVAVEFTDGSKQTFDYSDVVEVAPDLSEDFNAWLDEQSRDRLELAQDRADKRDTEWWDEDSFDDVLLDELRLMYVADTMADLARKGAVVATVQGDGSLAYRPVDA